MNELALFAGAGGGILGSHLLGWRTVAAVENDQYRREELLRRQRDGVLPLFPIWDDVKTFEGCSFSEIVDIVTAGFPCQPFSIAGKRRAGEDQRNMWPETKRILFEVGPRFALLENVADLLNHPYFGTILGDLAEIGFNATWDCIPASSVESPQERDRLWILAYTFKKRFQVSGDLRRLQQEKGGGSSTSIERGGRSPWPSKWNVPAQEWEPPRTFESRMGRGDNGCPHRVDRIKALGDMQVPAVVVRAWETLISRIVNISPEAKR